MEPVIKGVLSGLAYGLLLGPMFFLSLKITLTQGLRNGIALAIGAFVSDAILVLGSWYSAERIAAITKEQLFQSVFGVASGLLLLGFGIAALIPRKQTATTVDTVVAVTKLPVSALQGFLVNMSNPSNWLFWLSLATAAHAEATLENEHYTSLFLTATLIAVFSTDMAKVLILNRIGQRVKPGTTAKIVRVAGIILVCVSLWILWKVLFTT